MISKVFDGHSFYHACRYVCNKPGAQVLETEGVRGHNAKLMADDFIMQHESRPSKGQTCFHGTLSFYPGEDLEDATVIEIARRYLDRLGITNTQYAIVKHTDKAHPHLHIIANMVDNNGVSIPDSWIGYRGKKIAEQLTKEYNLIPAREKKLALTNLEALSQSEANRYKIYTAIAEGLPHCRNMEELGKRLLEQGIEIQYKYKGQTQEKQGVSFKIGNDCFKGSKIDRKFSLGNLEKILALKQKQVLQPLQTATSTPQQKTLTRKMISESKPSMPGKEPAHAVAEWISGILNELLKVEQTYNAQPYELLHEARKKRKKKKRS